VTRLRARTVVRLAHLWAGLALSVLLLVLALSGSALVYKEAWWRLVYPDLREAAAPVDAAGDVAGTDGRSGAGGGDAAVQAAAIEAAWDRYGDELRTLKLPTPDLAGIHVYLQEGEAFLTADGVQEIDRWTPRERVASWLFDLHAHLFAGERGEKVGGAIALVGVFLLLSGLYLWWPARRRTGFRVLVPKDGSRRNLIQWHRDLGLWTTPIVLVLLATGWGIVYYGSAGRLLNGLFGDPPVAAEPPPSATSSPAAGAPDARTMSAVQAAFPDARLVFWYPPTAEQPLHRFRLKQPCELHPNGRSYVFADGAGRVLQTTDACAQQPGERALHAVYPLHAGKTPSALYRLATFLGGLALAGLSASGALAYIRKLRAAR